MKYILINKTHINDVVKIAEINYQKEYEKVKSLPRIDFGEQIRNNLLESIKNELGVVAVEQDKVVGYMCAWQFNEFFGKSKGVYIPIECHGALGENRLTIYASLIKEVSRFWATKEIFSHGIGIYSHDVELKEFFCVSGYGMRTMDAMVMVDQGLKQLTKMTNNETQYSHIIYEEINYSELNSIFDLANKLIQHLNDAPVFFPISEHKYDDYINKIKEKKSRFLVAKNQETVIGYIELKVGGENFATYEKDTLNICGAYIEQRYRGVGIYSRLVKYAFEILESEGYIRCGVDCETINPEAYHYWKKIFTPYVYSYVRRIDERSKITKHNIEI